MSDTDRTARALAQAYAAGTLSPEARSAFEDRLADDQAARDALSRAVGRLHPDLRPRVGFRQAVKDRLRPRLWRRLLTPRPYPGHPSLWALAGAAAVLVAVLCWPTHSNRTSEHAVIPPAPRAVLVPDNIVRTAPTPARTDLPEEPHSVERPLDSQVVRGSRETRPLVAPMENP